MDANQITVIKEFIKSNPDTTNTQLAENIIKYSDSFAGYKKGTLQNYIGKVKKMIKEESELVPFKTLPAADFKEVTTPAFVTFDPRDPVVEEEVGAVIPTHYDFIIMSVKSDIFRQDFTEYQSTLSPRCISKVTVFGNEPREESIVDGTVTGVHGGIGRLTEDYCLYDAIDTTLASLIRTINNPIETDANITIAVPHIVDYGSKYATKASIIDLISRVKSTFGWSINLITESGDAREMAASLGIDSNNSINYTYSDECVEIMTECRAVKTDSFSQDEPQSSIGYFTY